MFLPMWVKHAHVFWYFFSNVKMWIEIELCFYVPVKIPGCYCCFSPAQTTAHKPRHIYFTERAFAGPGKGRVSHIRNSLKLCIFQKTFGPVPCPAINDTHPLCIYSGIWMRQVPVSKGQTLICKKTFSTHHHHLAKDGCYPVDVCIYIQLALASLACRFYTPPPPKVTPVAEDE